VFKLQTVVCTVYVMYHSQRQ